MIANRQHRKISPPMASATRMPMLVPRPSLKSENAGEELLEEEEVDAGLAAWPVTRKFTPGWYRSATVAVGQAVVVMMLREYHDETQGTVLATVAGREVPILPSAARTTLCPAERVMLR